MLIRFDPFRPFDRLTKQRWRGRGGIARTPIVGVTSSSGFGGGDPVPET
jgi:hypothetical protein